MSNYDVIKPENGVPIKAWTKGVALEDAAEKQLRNVATLPFVYKWVAAVPDVHWGIGATVGGDQRCDHPGSGRRRYRLRHDGGADHVARQRSAG